MGNGLTEEKMAKNARLALTKDTLSTVTKDHRHGNDINRKMDNNKLNCIGPNNNNNHAKDGY